MNARHETGDDWPALAASGRWRVIRCRDDIQFIVQRKAAPGGERPWRGVAYVVDPAALGVVLDRVSPGIPAADRAGIFRGLAAIYDRLQEKAV